MLSFYPTFSAPRQAHQAAPYAPIRTRALNLVALPASDRSASAHGCWTQMAATPKLHGSRHRNTVKDNFEKKRSAKHHPRPRTNERRRDQSNNQATTRAEAHAHAEAVVLDQLYSAPVNEEQPRITHLD
jgi:hypothetical protein